MKIESGDRITLKHEGGSTLGTVMLASRNGQALLVEIDAPVGPYTRHIKLLHHEGYDEDIYLSVERHGGPEYPVCIIPGVVH